MSNDLISRSALLEEINNFSMRITGSANTMAITIMGETKKSIAKLVDEQPTAYYVDKVVEQMEEYVKESSNVDYNRAMIEAIEIVKSGGVE